MGKDKEQEQEFIEIYDPIDEIESSHYAKILASEYSTDRYSIADLQAEAEHWIEQSAIPERSERSMLACLDVARAALFECAYRKGKIGIFIASQSGEMPDMSEALDELLAD